MRQQAQLAAAIVLAEEIHRRAAGPDHMAFDAVTWRDLGRILEVTERWAGRSSDPLGESRHILPVASSATTILVGSSSVRPKRVRSIRVS